MRKPKYKKPMYARKRFSFKKFLTIFLVTSLSVGGAVATIMLLNRNVDDPIKLTAPTVALVDDTATWEADALADKFEVSIDGALSYIENSTTSKKLTDGQTFKIRAVGDDKKYETSDWSNSVTYNTPTPKYTVTWKNGDTILETDEGVLQGSTPEFNGIAPSKPADAQYTYKFSGWSPAISEANGNVTYTATYEAEINKYTVTWKKGDVVLEIDSAIPYGEMPTYDAVLPEKSADAQYIYVFTGWSPEIGAVTSNATYTATFAPVPRTYTVIWKMGNTVLETDNEVAYGATPRYDGAAPIKQATAQYTYTFMGWTPQISAVTKSVTYEAQFSESVRSYTVTFYSEDGLSILDTVAVEYGKSAIYSKANPTKNATDAYTYTFEKWVTAPGGSTEDDLTSITSNKNVYASFISHVRMFDVHIISNNSSYGSVSVSTLESIPYGSMIEINNNIITINGKHATAIESTDTKKYSYTFVNWTTPATVGTNTYITANFARTINSYTIVWKNGNEILETDENIQYGLTPVYNGPEPTVENAGENYIFSGWSPSISSVTDNATYYAQFINVTGKYVVNFYDEDGEIMIGRSIVNHGETAVYPNSLPTKEETSSTTYSFDKWVTVPGGAEEASLENITQNKSVYAKYTESKKMFTVTFLDWDGSVIEEQSIAYGESAIKPEDPYRESYRFTGWDNGSAYSNVTSDVTVKATYIQQFVVEFLDYDNSVIDIQLIDNRGSATAPQAPTRNNYRFIGWIIGAEKVKVEEVEVVTNLTIKADYIKQYKVTFIDFDRTVLKEVLVDEGSHVEAPIITDNPKYSENGLDYKTVLWDSPLDNVTSNFVTKAQYTVKTFAVTFRMPDGTMIGDPQTVKYGEDAIAPMYSDDFLKGKILYPDDLSEFPKMYFDFGDQKTVSYFSGWSTTLENIKENKEIYAEYKTAYEQPVIFVQAVGNTLKVQMYCPEICYIYGLEFGFNWNGSGTIENCIEILGESKDAEYNNKNKTFKYMMFEGNGFTSQSNYFDIAEITYSGSHGFTLDIYDLIISTDCSIICGTKANLNAEELSRITPIILIK